MSGEVGREAALERARAAREVSAGVCDRARLLAEQARRLRAARDELGEARRRDAGRRLDLQTRAVDDGVVEWSVFARFIEASGRVVGRDPAIEDAKTFLCERYGVSRGEAFQLLRRLSSRQQRKLREVAREYAQAARSA